MKIDRAFGPYQVGDIIYNGVIIRQVEALPTQGEELKTELLLPDVIVELPNHWDDCFERAS